MCYIVVRQSLHRVLTIHPNNTCYSVTLTLVKLMFSNNYIVVIASSLVLMYIYTLFILLEVFEMFYFMLLMTIITVVGCLFMAKILMIC